MHHQVYHADQNSRFAAFGEQFIIFAQSAVATKPGECAFDNPAAFQDDKSCVGPFDNFDDPRKRLQRPIHKLTGVATIGPDAPQARKAAMHPLQHNPPSVAILNIGGVNHHRKDQAERVYNNVALAPGYFLAGIVSAARAPFSTVFTLWLSTIAALGVACLPACIRTCSRRTS